MAGRALGLVVGLEQERARAAGRVVDGLLARRRGADADDLGHDPRHLGRRVELALALATLGGEVPHQVLVGVAEQVVALGAVAAKVERRAVEDADQVGQPIDHLLALAQLVGVVPVRHVDHPAQPVRLGEPPDDLVQLVADLLVALERHHVGEPAALRHLDVVALLARRLVRHVLHEQQHQDVVLVLRRVHAAAELVARTPEGRVQLGLLDGHGQATGIGATETKLRRRTASTLHRGKIPVDRAAPLRRANDPRRRVAGPGSPVRAALDPGVTGRVDDACDAWRWVPRRSVDAAEGGGRVHVE